MTRFFLSNLSNSLIMEDPVCNYSASGPHSRNRIRPVGECRTDRHCTEEESHTDRCRTEDFRNPAVPLPPSPLSPLSYIRAKKILRQQLHERQLLARRRLVNSLYTREE